MLITDSKANYFEPDKWRLGTDYKRTNYFEYKENINAAYINFNKQLTKKLGMQSRIEIRKHQLYRIPVWNIQKADSSFNSTYNGIFPNCLFQLCC